MSSASGFPQWLLRVEAIERGGGFEAPDEGAVELWVFLGVVSLMFLSWFHSVGVWSSWTGGLDEGSCSSQSSSMVHALFLCVVKFPAYRKTIKFSFYQFLIGYGLVEGI